MREARMFFEISLRFLVIFIYGFETCLFWGKCAFLPRNRAGKCYAVI